MQQSPGLNSDEIIDTVKDQFFKDFRTNGGGGGGSLALQIIFLFEMKL